MHSDVTIRVRAIHAEQQAEETWWIKIRSLLKLGVL